MIQNKYLQNLLYAYYPNSCNRISVLYKVILTQCYGFVNINTNICLPLCYILDLHFGITKKTKKICYLQTEYINACQDPLKSQKSVSHCIMIATALYTIAEIFALVLLLAPIAVFRSPIVYSSPKPPRFIISGCLLKVNFFIFFAANTKLACI